MTTPSVGMELFVFCILKAVAVVVFLCRRKVCCKYVCLYVPIQQNATVTRAHTSQHCRRRSWCGCSVTWARRTCAAAVKCAVPGQRWLKQAPSGDTCTLSVGPEVRVSVSVQWCEIILALSISETVIM